MAPVIEGEREKIEKYGKLKKFMAVCGIDGIEWKLSLS